MKERGFSRYLNFTVSMQGVVLGDAFQRRHRDTDRVSANTRIDSYPCEIYIAYLLDLFYRTGIGSGNNHVHEALYASLTRGHPNAFANIDFL